MIDYLRDNPASAYGPQVDALREQALEFAAGAREKLVGGERQLRDYIKEKPAAALGIAMGVGVLLGWLIKRR